MTSIAQTTATSDGRRRIFIVDDHPLVRESLVALIDHQRDLRVCGEAGDSASAFNLLVRESADLVIIDLSLPGESGLELIKKLRTLKPAPQMLVLSMHDELLYAERALRAGALGYVMKRDTSDKVVEAIRSILDGNAYVSGALAAGLAKKYVGIGPKKDIAVAELLSDRELEVFQLLGHGYETRRIAQELHLSMKTVQAHCTSIKDKLGLDNPTELIREAVRWTENRYRQL